MSIYCPVTLLYFSVKVKHVANAFIDINLKPEDLSSIQKSFCVFIFTVF